LEGVLEDLTETGEKIGQVDTADPSAIGVAFVEMYQLRHRYENLTPNLPDCALRGHTYFMNILSNWEDILGLALATFADPGFAEGYIAEIAVLSERIEFFTPLLLAEFFPPQVPTPLPPTATPPAVLNTFYVATQGLNVRLGPGPEFAAVGVLTGGSEIQVLALDTLPNEDVWYEIVYPPSPTGRGWVFGALISQERPAEFPAPLPTPTAGPSPTPTPRPQPTQEATPLG
jgi:hypothetical protein